MSQKRYVAGIDVGTSYCKAVVVDIKKSILGSYVQPSGANLQTAITKVYTDLLADAALPQEAIVHITSTGFGRNDVSYAQSSKTEISCHAKGAFQHHQKKMTIVDIGGQDTEIIKVSEKGKILGFKMNRKCAAGTGVFLEEIAHKLDIPLDKLNALASDSSHEGSLSSFCTVFASTEILTRIREGEKIEDVIKSAYESVIQRVIEMDTLDGTVMLTGGVIEYHSILRGILKQRIESPIIVPPYPQLIGAFGAALYALDAAKY